MAILDRAKEIAAPPPVGSPYSIPVPNSEQPGRSAVYRHWRFQDALLQTLDPNITTVHHMFEDAANRNSTSKCLGYRPYDPVKKDYGPYKWMNYGTVQKRRANFGVGIVEANKRAGVEQRKYGIGLWCQNRPEWQLTDLACMSQALYTVSLYDTLGPTAVEYIIDHAQLTCVATSLPHIPTLLKLKSKLGCLKVIISLDALDEGDKPGHSKYDLLKTMASDADVQIYSIQQVEALGESLGSPVYHVPGPSDPVTINYTSGTTGPPKGVVLTHSAAVAAASTGLTIMPSTASDIFVSYLPLAHIYERVTEQGALWSGAAIGYFHGDVLALVDDMKLLRPTGFISVPRLYNRFGGAIREATTSQPSIKGALARHVVSTKTASLEHPDSPNATNRHALYDRIWGRRVAAALGLDRTKIMVSGSAPLDPSLQTFLRTVLGNQFVQGYGLTETYATSLAQLTGDYSTGNCGAVTPSNEVCLASVPDMQYLVTDQPQPRGELLVRGYTIFSGYYKNEEDTQKCMLPDGWFRTGDIATVDSRGRFQIIDRLKNVLKLAQGEYISPERIENVYLSHLSFLSQAYVHGDSSQNFLVALFGVLPELFAPFASKVLRRSIGAANLQAIVAACKDEKVRAAVVKELDKVGKKNKFAGYERVRNCYLYLEPFTIDNELMTPTLKIKRPQCAKKFRKELDELYAEALAVDGKSGSVRARL